MPTNICPYCGKSVKRLRYETLGAEVGVFDGENYLSDDFIPTEDHFYCIECGYEIEFDHECSAEQFLSRDVKERMEALIYLVRHMKNPNRKAKRVVEAYLRKHALELV